LEPRLAQDSNHEIRYELVRWLDSRPGPATEEQILQLCEDEYSDVSGLATAVRWQRNPSPETLSKVWKDEVSLIFEFFPGSAEPKTAIAQALLRRTNVLFEQIKDCSVYIRLQVADKLLNTNYRSQALSILFTLLVDPNAEIRVRAACRLCNTGYHTQA